jgi:hypothetical protein
MKVKRDVVDAIESLLAYRTEDLGCYEFVLEAWMEEAASEIKRLRSERRWVPVSGRLPETGLRVLAFVQCQPHEHCHTVGAFMFNGKWVFDEHYEDASEPTHWMPLPEPPVRS